MKSPLKKLCNNGRDKSERDQEQRHRIEQSRAQFDEITRASQDMQDMKECYNSLLSAAAATANSAYEFSESLQEMGTCLLQETALNDDEESGKVLLMLGKLQFKLQGLVDKYRAHIIQTITVPSESLLNEIRTVEEMKKECDEKRSLYKNMMAMRQDKKRSKCIKGETYSSQQVKAAREDYDQEATLFVFRLKSLKQGQSRSLLTQAARHHASQLNFFKKALMCLESVEPHVQKVTEENHIDYQFSGLEDDRNDNDDTDYDDDDDDDDYDGDDDGDDGESCRSNNTDDGYCRNDDNGELSFEYREKEPMGYTDPTPSRSKEEKLSKKYPQDAFALAREVKASSQSAPLSASKKFYTNKKLIDLKSLNSKKFHSYVLPTPTEPKTPIPSRPKTQPLENTHASPSRIAPNYRHSSPMEQLKYSPSPVLRDRNGNGKMTDFPPSKSAEIPLRAYDRYATYDADRSRRLSFSGPLIGMTRTSNFGAAYTSGSMASVPRHLMNCPPGLRPSPLSPPPRPSSLSPQQSPNVSPPVISPIKINELHQLPRPPAHPRVSPPPLQMPVS